MENLSNTSNINRKSFINSYGHAIALVGSTYLLFFNSGCNNVDKKNDKRPNIFFVIADDMSWLHISIRGDPVVKTPIKELLTNQNYKDVKEQYGKQLKISWN